MPYQLSIISVVFCRREPLFFMKVDIPVLHTAYAYDRAGNRTSVQAGDRREIYHYDRGRLTTRTVEHTQDPAGKTYTYRYDAQGNTLGDGENTYPLYPRTRTACIRQCACKNVLPLCMRRDGKHHGHHRHQWNGIKPLCL